MDTSLPHSPDGFGISVVDVVATDGGWSVAVAVPGDLHGPQGILQGGLTSSLGWVAARTLLDEHGAVPGRQSADISSVHARLRRPTPTGALLHLDVRVEDLIDLHVEVRNGDEVTMRCQVELAGPPPVPLLGDLADLVSAPVPPAQPQDAFSTCIVCGMDNPRGLHVPPHPIGRTGMSTVPWMPDDRVDDGSGHVHPVATSAVLDCPGVWAGLFRFDEADRPGAALLADYRVQWFHAPPLGQPTRTVARVDDVVDRQLHVRTAIHDRDGRLCALATAMHVLAAAVPPPPAAATPLSGRSDDGS